MRNNRHHRNQMNEQPENRRYQETIDCPVCNVRQKEFRFMIPHDLNYFRVPNQSQFESQMKQMQQSQQQQQPQNSSPTIPGTVTSYYPALNCLQNLNSATKFMCIGCYNKNIVKMPYIHRYIIQKESSYEVKLNSQLKFKLLEDIKIEQQLSKIQEITDKINITFENSKQVSENITATILQIGKAQLSSLMTDLFDNLVSEIMRLVQDAENKSQKIKQQEKEYIEKNQDLIDQGIIIVEEFQKFNQKCLDKINYEEKSKLMQEALQIQEQLKMSNQ